MPGQGSFPHCTEFQGRAAALSGEPSWYEKWYATSYQRIRTYGLVESRIVDAGRDGTMPLLLLATASAQAPTSAAAVQTILYRYDRAHDRFRAVFVNDGGGNNNQDARFVESGPLRGDEIVDFPTEHAPYVYWMEVYAPQDDGPYHRILRYRSSTHYADGNPLPVSDSEMPAIMERLGLWKPGDALPVPSRCPRGADGWF